MARGDVVFFQEALARALENWAAANTLKLAILDDTSSPTASDSDPDLSDYTEVGASGTYTAGGTSLGTWGDFVSQAGAVTTFDSTTNPTWAQDASNDNDAYWGLVYNDDDGDRALCYVDLGGPVDMSAGDLTVTWNASGIVTITIT